MDHRRPALSFVLPAHNEAQNVAAMAAALAKVAVPHGSTDDTLAEIKALAARHEAVRYVSFTRNFGHQAALRAGLRHARGEAVVLMDCDFEHPPEVVPLLVEQWRLGAKVVVTQRMEVNGFEDRDVFLRGLVRWLGFPLAKVPYAQGTRSAGSSKFTLRRMVDFAVSGIVAHSVKPLRLAIYLALTFALIGLLLLIYSVVSFLWVPRTVTGWTSMMAAVALLGAGQLLVLGIIGEYVGRILRETRRWPVYIVAETELSREPVRPAQVIGERAVSKA